MAMAILPIFLMQRKKFEGSWQISCPRIHYPKLPVEHDRGGRDKLRPRLPYAARAEGVARVKPIARQTAVRLV